MFKLKNYIIVLLLFLIFPIKGEAACTTSELARLKKISSNVSISSDYVEYDTSVSFNIKVTNIHNEIIVKDTYKNINLTTTSSELYEIVNSGYPSGTTIKFEIIAKNGECGGSYLTEKYINLPSYNPFYKNSLCNGLDKFKYCQKWITANITYEQFVKLVDEYKKSIEVVVPPVEIEDNTDVVTIILKFLFDYYQYILIAIIIINSIIIYRNRKKDTFGF